MSDEDDDGNEALGGFEGPEIRGPRMNVGGQDLRKI